MLKESGWNAGMYRNAKMRYNHENGIYSAQLPLEELFDTARDIIEYFDGLVIYHVPEHLRLGVGCFTIEFNYFEYDNSLADDLEYIYSKTGSKAVFIGHGYDIIGDWIVCEDGRFFFLDRIRERLSFMSGDIYSFLEGNVISLYDMNGQYIFRS